MSAAESRGEERRGFKSEGLAEAHPAGGGQFSFTSSSKRCTVAAGPSSAFGTSQGGLPDPASASAFLQVSHCMSRVLWALPPLTTLAPCPHAGGRNWGRDVQHPAMAGVCSTAILPGKRSINHQRSHQSCFITRQGKTRSREGRGCRGAGESFQAFHQGMAMGQRSFFKLQNPCEPWHSTPGHGEVIHTYSRCSSQAEITTDEERRFLRNALS